MKFTATTLASRLALMGAAYAVAALVVNIMEWPDWAYHSMMFLWAAHIGGAVVAYYGVRRKNVRAFIGLRVGGKAVGELEETRKRLAAVLPEDTRWERGGYHITLRFLGELPWGDVEKVTIGPSHEEFTLSVGDLGTFPAEGPPKVLWAGVGGDLSSLGHIQEAVDEVASKEHGPADYPFHPHITIARFRDMTEEEGERVRQALQTFERPLYGRSWTVKAIDLLCSTRGLLGVRYRSLGTIRLRPTRQDAPS